LSTAKKILLLVAAGAALILLFNFAVTLLLGSIYV
jgi:hypothetical protein